MVDTPLIPLELIPNTQNLSSTFRIPPLDCSLNAAEIYDWHQIKNPDYPLFVFNRSNGGIRTITWDEATQAIHVGVRHIRDIMGWTAGLAYRTPDPPVVALLTTSDSISYWTMMSAIYRAGYIAFPLSSRNSPSAVADLLKKRNVQHLLVGHEAAIQILTDSALELLKDEQPTTSKIPLFADLFEQPKVDPEHVVYERRAADDVIAYLHSSGSTSFPKAIPFTNKRFIQLSLQPFFGDRDMTGSVNSMHLAPMFHALAFLHMSCAVGNGMTLSHFEPRNPAQIWTPRAHFESAVATGCNMLVTVPSVLEAWAENDEYVEWLAKRTGVMITGGELSETVGLALAKKGVSIFTAYGSTEAGGVGRVFEDAATFDPLEYMWAQVSGNVIAEFIPQGDGTYELVVMAHALCQPGVINVQVRGMDAYATSDLFIPHPTKDGFWKVFGRKDDQIAHSTGEKTNPVPIEAIVNGDPHVRAAVIFGAGRFQAGILLDPHPDYALSDVGLESDNFAAFIELVWPAIQKANEMAPSHSRIFKEMIIVSKSTKPFTYTAKGTARRQAVIKDYEDEINQTYARLDQSSAPASLAPPLSDSLRLIEALATSTSDHGVAIPDLAPIQAYVRGVLTSAGVDEGVGEEDSIFDYGCDSLQAAWIRNTLVRALESTGKLDTAHLPKNFVYTYPSILALSHSIYTAITGRALPMTPAPTAHEAIVAEMRAMVDKYSGDFVNHPNLTSGSHLIPTLFAPTTDNDLVVLLTGTTGGLGSYVLDKLLRDTQISKVYALNRKGRSGLMNRQKMEFVDRGLDPTILDVGEMEGKLVLLEGDLLRSDLGLSPPIFDEMSTSVTRIMHNAWPVNFHMPIGNFEPMFKGLRNLINFALLSAHLPTFIFASSFSTYQSSPASPTRAKEGHIPPEYALGTGYAESKWIAEEILTNASRATGLPVLNVRIGQLTGGHNGCWNRKEWFPSLVVSAATIGCFPECGPEKTVGFVPLALGAKAFVEFMHQSISGPNTVHLVPPQPTVWNFVARTIADELGIPLIPIKDWAKKVQALEASLSPQEAAAMHRSDSPVPILRLRDMLFASMIVAARRPYTDATGSAVLDSEMAQRLSASLRDPRQVRIHEGDIRNWLRFWGVGGGHTTRPQL